MLYISEWLFLSESAAFAGGPYSAVQEFGSHEMDNLFLQSLIYRLREANGEKKMQLQFFVF